jgi:hypothetical protein
MLARETEKQSEMAELFIKQTENYSEGWPCYPQELFQFIASKTPSQAPEAVRLLDVVVTNADPRSQKKQKKVQNRKIIHNHSKHQD